MQPPPVTEAIEDKLEQDRTTQCVFVLPPSTPIRTSGLESSILGFRRACNSRVWSPSSVTLCTFDTAGRVCKIARALMHAVSQGLRTRLIVACGRKAARMQSAKPVCLVVYTATIADEREIDHFVCAKTCNIHCSIQLT